MSVTEQGALEALNAIYDEHPEVVTTFTEAFIAPELARPMIHRAMIRAMRAIGAVTKSQEYNGGGARYNFRGIDAVVNATGPALRDAGIYILPEVIESRRADTWTGANKTQSKETFVRVRYTFTAEDGSSVAATVEGESLDTSDKGLAKAASVALRILLLQTFQIPTDDPDPDSQHLERGGAGQMSDAVKAFLRKGLTEGPLSGIAELWELVEAHAAMEQVAMEGESGRITWYGLVRTRLVTAIEAAATVPAARALWTELGAAKEITVAPHAMAGDVLKVRLKTLASEALTRENEFATRIGAATTREEVGAVVVEMNEALKADLLSQDRHVNLHSFAQERGEKLEREARGRSKEDGDFSDPAEAAAFADEPVHGEAGK